MGDNKNGVKDHSEDKKRFRDRAKDFLKELLEDRRPPFKTKVKREDKEIVRVLAILYGFFLVVMPYIPTAISTLFDALISQYPIGVVPLLLSLVFFPLMALFMGIEILKSLLRLGLTYGGAFIFCIFCFLVSLTYLSFTIIAVQSIAILTPEMVRVWSNLLLEVYCVVLVLFSISVVWQEEFRHAKEAADAGDPWYDSAKVTEEKDEVLDI